MLQPIQRIHIVICKNHLSPGTTATTTQHLLPAPAPAIPTRNNTVHPPAPLLLLLLLLLLIRRLLRRGRRRRLILLLLLPLLLLLLLLLLRLRRRRLLLQLHLRGGVSKKTQLYLF